MQQNKKTHTDLRALLAQIDAQIETLRIRREFVVELLGNTQAEPNWYAEAAATPPPVVERVRGRRRGSGGLVKAILEVIANNPKGISAVDLVDAVEATAKSKAKNKRRSIASTVYQLRKAGRLKQDAAGKYIPTGSP